MKRVLFTLLACGIAISSASAANSNQLTTQTDKFSYVIGLNMGQSFKTQGVQINPNQVLKGMQDGLSGAKPLVNKQQQQEIMVAFQKQAMQKYQAKMAADAKANMTEGSKFLAANAKKSGVRVTKSGLQYKVLTAGKGTSPSATDMVTVNYQGSLINGKVFDSSYKRGQPAKFKVNQVIKGWTEALQMMKPGATWMLYIPADLAYGSHAMGGLIPPGSTLIFKVNLISVQKAK